MWAPGLPTGPGRLTDPHPVSGSGTVHPKSAPRLRQVPGDPVELPGCWAAHPPPPAPGARVGAECPHGNSSGADALSLHAALSGPSPSPGERRACPGTGRTPHAAPGVAGWAGVTGWLGGPSLAPLPAPGSRVRAVAEAGPSELHEVAPGALRGQGLACGMGDVPGGARREPRSAPQLCLLCGVCAGARLLSRALRWGQPGAFVRLCPRARQGSQPSSPAAASPETSGTRFVPWRPGTGGAGVTLPLDPGTRPPPPRTSLCPAAASSSAGSWL